MNSEETLTPEELDQIFQRLEQRTSPVTQTVLIDIVRWNRDRNQLALDFNLEAKMLSEEAHEFFTSDTFEEQVREYADFLFVFTGTVSKFCSVRYQKFDSMLQVFEAYRALNTWAHEIREEMFSLLLATLECSFPEAEEDELKSLLLFIVGEVLKLITNANMKKGTQKDKSGKIMKGADYVDPEPEIRETIQSILATYKTNYERSPV